MLIEIKRNNTNDLYTEGRLHINDMRTTFTIESTETMLPVGIYQVKIVKKSARKQSLVIFNENTSTEWALGICLSWIGSKKQHIIGIGQPFFPGALYKATAIYERIVDRLMKCEARGEGVRLIITDDNITHGLPISHWLEPSTHGCPHSNRRVEPIDDRTYDIYDGDVFVKTIVIPEKKD